MIFLEKITTKVTMAVRLIDTLSPDSRTKGNVWIKVLKIPKKSVNKVLELSKKSIRYSGGYFLLLDVPKGKYKITASGEFYKEKTMDINTSSLKPILPIGPKPSSPKLPVAEIKLTRK